MCGSMAVVVVSWCQVVHVTVVASSSGCHVASCDVAPLAVVNEEAGRGVVLLTWAGHDVAAVIVVVAGARWWWWWMGCVVEAGGGGKEEATTWQCLSHGCRIWEATCRDGLYGALVCHIAKPL